YFPPNLEQFNCIQTLREEVKINLKQVELDAKPVRGKTTKVFWELTSNSGNKLKYIQEEGSIYIQKSGKYYISSQLTTRVENSTMAFNQEDQKVRHVVHLIPFKKGTERVLLEHVKSMCEMTGEYADWTSNIGAVYHLDDHDRIYVTTSHPYNIVSGSGSNFFSIHEI
ncbi:uncharacterized protein LOC128554643, partial [Mercenaria mercenaria]|uniref:uncharacterized protein LOC128554643 n=1 Tax=Mercenaria mercenaria TaxID=6596 RepID=UPI00234E45AB